MKIQTPVLRGAKGGSSSSRKPVEAPDSLHSIDYARILDLISEGEIIGLKDGLRSVFLDETPVANADGSLNFKNVQVDTRVGTQDQEYIKGFPAVESELGVNLELQYGTPWTRGINNVALSAVRLRLSTPALSQANTTNGDISGYTVAYAIDLSTDGGSFQTVLNSAFTGKTTSKYVRSHRIDLPNANSGWVIRVRRLTPQASSGSIADTTYVESFAEIMDGKFRYPCSALAAVVVDASQFQNIPTRSYHIRGRIVQVPTNYDPLTRTYTGVWDGTFKPAWTNNPAWIYYDLGTHPRYGLGHLVQPSQVDKWSLYKIARYCDELVPDGEGGYEPRFTCNVYLQTRTDAFKLLQDMASIFRGISFWTGAAIKATADMPEDPVYVYTGANVIDSKFLYQSSGKKARHTVAMVSWNDPSDFGRSKIEPVVHEEGIARYGINPTDVIAFGCTSRSQAFRAGRWLLLTEFYETNTVTFSVGLDGTVAQPGQVVLIADAGRAGRRIGGRVSLATNSVITVDAVPTVAAGDTITCILPSAVAQERVVQSVVGRNIAVTVPFEKIPVVGAVWTVKTSALSPQRFRVMNVVKNTGEEVITFTITALQHVEGKFDAVELGYSIEQPPISVLPPAVQLPPTGIVITHREVAGEITAQVVVNVDWEPVQAAVNYDVEWRTGRGEWINAGRVAGSAIDVPNVRPGPFEARITAINSLGIKSAPVKSAVYEVPDQNAAPNGMITPGKLGGRGVNLLPDQYSTLAQTTLPQYGAGNVAVARSTDFKQFEGSWLLTRIGVAAEGYLNLMPGGNQVNIPRTPARRYIVSFWYLTNVAGNHDVYLYDGVSGFSGGQYTTVGDSQWHRTSVIVDPSAFTTALMGLRLDFDTATVGASIRFDGIMVEEAVGTLNQPSAYARGQTSQMAVSAIAAAAAAQDTADGKIDSYFQSSAPVIGPNDAKLGDLWFDTAHGNKQYRCNGSTWVAVQDTAIGDAIAAAAGAQATADGKVKTFYAASTATPAASGVGDLWYQTDFGILLRWSGSAWVKVGDNSTIAVTDYCPNNNFAQGTENWEFQAGWYTETTGGYFDQRHATAAPGAPVDSRISNSRIFTVTPGEVYAISAMYKSIGANGTHGLGLILYDANNNQVAVVEPTVTGITGSWSRRKSVIVIPAGAAGARVTAVRYGHTAGYMYLWDVKVTRLTSDAAENVLGIGKNLMPNANFGGANGAVTPWQYYNGGAGGLTITLRNKRIGIDGGASWTLTGTIGQMSVYSGHPQDASKYWDIVCGKEISVEGGQRYEMSIYFAAHRCNHVFYIDWRDKDGNNVGYSATFDTYGPVSGGPLLTGYQRIAYFTAAPATAAKATFIIRRYNHGSPEADSYSWYAQAYFGKATDNQTQFSDWADAAPSDADSISSGVESGVVNTVDLVDIVGYRRIGLRISNSGQRLGSQRNTVRTQTSTYGSVRTATALSATSAGAVSVNAHSVRYGSFTVAYNAVSNAVTGLTPGSTYVIYCYDGDYSGGTKTWFAGTNPDAVMQLGDDIIVAGQITIPTSGSSSGGGSSGGSNPGDWCVAADSFLPDGTSAGDLGVGQMLPCYNHRPDEPNIVHLRVQANRQADAECLRLVTASGATIVASTTTPMTLRNGASVLLPDMLHREALVYRRDGSFAWEPVVELQPAGVRRVAKISVSNQCYFAGETQDAFIATHNVQMKP